jgi:hypothetical protein
MLALQDAGFAVLLPFGENTRYDLVIDNGTSLARVQCKTGKLSAGAVRFPTCSTSPHPNVRNPHRDYLGQIDYFAVYCPQTTGVYLIPIDEIALARQGALRIDPPRNNQRRRVRYAERYALRSVRVASSPEPDATVGVADLVISPR